MTKPTSTCSPQCLFLSSLGFIQLIAYWSYYVQFPGLLSSSGIDPVQRRFSHIFPWIHALEWMDEDSLCELLALTGMVVSAIIASGVCQHGLLFALTTIIYSVLFRTGGTFYSFQWDILLLETSFVTCLTYAPWTTLKVTEEPSIISPIPLRFLLFKLMFMSGVVKLQAHCPTWENLTALEYHFATQCLPGPLAWYFHQLPPLLLRIGVAATLWVEIPAAALLVVPLATARRIGAGLQAALQVLIILTGNYNFFNILTMTLCIPVWDTSPDGDVPLWPRLQTVLVSLCSFASMTSMFWMERMGRDDHWNIGLRTESIWLDPENYLPWIPYAVMVMMVVTFISVKKQPRKVFHALVCMVVVASITVPLDQIVRNKSIVSSSFGPAVSRYTRPLGLINGYGLFRRMTGVGQNPRGVAGWAGLPPSVVARPEIILEGGYKSNGSNETAFVWEELDVFRWKPHSVNGMPRQVAPYQPRLDWQMWFAALGSIERNSWLVSYIQKLLSGCQPVLEMVGADFGDRVPQKIRAKLYSYDFTRYNTTWSRTIPGIEVVSENSNKNSMPVWSRHFVREYLPAVSEVDLANFLNAHGYVDLGIDGKERCRNAAEKNPQWCKVLYMIRKSKTYLIAPVFLAFFLLQKVSPLRQGRKNEVPSIGQQKKNQ